MTQMTASKKRWFVLVPLLAGAAWLAVFGDKTPANTANQTVGPGVSAATVDKALATRSLTQTNPDVTKPSATLVPATSVHTLLARVDLFPHSKNKNIAVRDLFANRSWTPPPPPVKVAPPAPPPTPVAPPLAFTFIGKKLEAGAWEVFLARGEQSFVVREGSVIDNTYRIDKISPPNLSLTYLPLGQAQSLSIGESR